MPINNEIIFKIGFDKSAITEYFSRRFWNGENSQYGVTGADARTVG